METPYSFEFLQLKAALQLSGCSMRTIEDLQRIVQELLKNKATGYRRLGKTLKLWKSITVDILARKDSNSDGDRDDCSHSRILSRSVHILREQGWSDADIKSAVDFQGRRRIPPFLLDPSLSSILLPEWTYAVARRVVPLVNISRTGPIGGELEIQSALEGFSVAVTRPSGWSFDFSGAVARMLRRMDFQMGRRSIWKLSSKSSLDYPRSLGGKVEEFRRSYVDSFRKVLVSDVVTSQPVGDLYDITGTLTLRASDYDPGRPFCEVAYPDVGIPTSEVCDSRLGHLGLFWALRELRKLPGIDFDAVEDFPNLAVGCRPTLRLDLASIDARVAPIAEAGLKVRVVTITPFFVALIGDVARNLLFEPLMNMDPTNRIGLTSKVKLYDFLVHLNGGSHNGVADQVPNQIWFEWAASVDLTTATDTPDLDAIRSLLRGSLQAIGNHPARDFLELAVDLATCERRFCLPNGTIIENHKSGIMMGEGLSGIFLNLSTMFVRYSVREFMARFPGYSGTSVADADDFIRNHVAEVQALIRDLRFDDPVLSVQCGDDMSGFSYRQLSGYLFLVYRCFNYVPSENSWYESNSFMTFTEEVAVRTADSNGWTFVDTIKPRLFRSLDSQGEVAVASRIKQIGDSLRYRDDPELSRSMCPICDEMISSCRSMARVIDQLDIPVGLPNWLGGIGHPCGLEPSYLLDVDQRYRDYLYFLSEADSESLAQIFCVGNELDLADGHQLLLSTMVCSMMTGMEVQTIEEVSETSWISLDNLDVPRLPGEKYSHWYSRKVASTAALGLISLTDFSSWVTQSLRTRDKLSGVPDNETPIAFRLRRIQSFIFSTLPDEYIGSSEMNSKDIFSVFRDTQSVLSSRLWDKQSLITQFGLEDFPSFSVSFNALGTGPERELPV